MCAIFALGLVCVANFWLTSLKSFIQVLFDCKTEEDLRRGPKFSHLRRIAPPCVSGATVAPRPRGSARIVLTAKAEIAPSGAISSFGTKNLDRYHCDSPPEETSREVSDKYRSSSLFATSVLEGRSIQCFRPEESALLASEYRSPAQVSRSRNGQKFRRNFSSRTRGTAQGPSSGQLDRNQKCRRSECTDGMFFHGNENILRRRFRLIYLPKIIK